MDENIIKLESREVDISKVTDEELLEIHKEVKSNEKKYKMAIKRYLAKYPFLEEK